MGKHIYDILPQLDLVVQMFRFTQLFKNYSAIPAFFVGFCVSITAFITKHIFPPRFSLLHHIFMTYTQAWRYYLSTMLGYFSYFLSIVGCYNFEHIIIIHGCRTTCSYTMVQSYQRVNTDDSSGT